MEVGIVGDRTVEAEDGDVPMETAPEDFSDSHVANGLTKDSSENEVFEDAIDDAESLNTPKYVESGVFLEGNSGDSSFGQGLESIHGFTDVEFNDQSPDEDKLVSSEVVDSITRSQGNDASFGQLETATAKEEVGSQSEEQEDSYVAIPAFNKDDSHGDVEDLNADVFTEGECLSCQNLAEPHGKETADESENSDQAEDREGKELINLSGDESDGTVVETYCVPGDDGEIVSESDNENLGIEKTQNGVIGDETSFRKQSVDGIEYEEDISNKHEIEEIESKGVDDIREGDGIKAEADSLLVEEGSAYSDVTSENEESLTQSGGPIYQSNMPKESVFVENIGESSSTDDDENNAFTQQVSASRSHPEPSLTPSLPSRPAGLGSSAPLLEPTPRSLQPSRVNGSVSHQQNRNSENSVPDDTEESDEIREKLQMIRVKFLRLAHRLGQTPHNVVVAQVLYRLGLAEQLRRNTNRQGVFSFDQASVMAEQLEAAGKEPLNFTCTIMVIGKTGVGKSATINSIFDHVKVRTDAFQLSTKKFQDVVGTVQGIQVRVIDTPGLSSCPSDQRRNEKILNSIKSFISKTPPDIVLYFDRLDMQSRDFGDVPLLRTITDVFGASIWFNAIVVLTHAASAPPDGPNGSPLSYEMFVTQRSHVVQQAIRQAAGDVRLMNPVSLVENHTACRMNRAGQRVLPNGQVWKPQLLLLSFASKILQEANMLLKLEDSPPGRPFGSRTKAPPLPFLLSSLLQTRPHLKLPEEQMDDEDNMFDDLEETSDEDDGSDYDELPPFKSLTRSQLAKLSKAQRNAYYEELDYREKLFIKKQIKEEKKRRKLLKKMNESVPDVPIDHGVDQNIEDESGGPASVPVPMPDLVLPNSFDSDYPTHRYRYLDSSNKWLVRPVLETQGWDHDVGYEGLNVERLFVVKNKIPLSISGQITKDKKDCSLQMELASSLKHSQGTVSSVGLDLQTVGKDMAYTLRGETKFQNFRCNNTAAGLSVTILGDTISAGAKIEDKLTLNKRLSMLISGGAMTGRGDVAYGGRLEATLREKNYPIGRSLSTIALSVVDWHGDLALGCNIQTQHSLGRGTNLICHGNLSNKGSGQVGIRLNTSDQVQIALVALLPIVRSIIRMLSVSSEPL
ncbi:hypothetical protein M5K25_018603 [Dendrobium thyrsiflorum]|uniref:AIG1-type G domain-containing protein n=1 Tax=Dendrobium thyrsiflorum TaxID=117978 RepID=A0ABD0UIP2_DENTH